MVKQGIFVRLHAKPGKEADVANLLEGAVGIVNGEPLTKQWYAVRFDKQTFGIFDTFDGEEGRQAHLAGQVAAALMAKAPELLAEPPKIEKVDILASKVT